METNEIMVNEEVVETAAEEIVSKSSHKGLKIAAGTGVAIILGGLAVRFVVLPAIAKFKAKKNDVVIDEEFVEEDNDTFTEDSDSEEEN